MRDGFLGGPEGEGGEGAVEGGGEDDGWLRTGGTTEKEQEGLRGQVRTMSESGSLGRAVGEEEEEIPDIEDDDDDNEAIIRDKGGDFAAWVSCSFCDFALLSLSVARTHALTDRS